MLSPFAPHTCEELWERLGHDRRPGRGALAGVRRRRRAGRGDRGAGAGQRQGARPHHRRRPTPPRTSSGRRRWQTPPCSRTCDREDRQESHRGAGQARQRGGGADGSTAGSCSDFWRPVQAAAWRAATRSPATARSCRPTSRRSGCRSSSTRRRITRSRTSSAEDVRTEFINRGKYKIAARLDRRRRAADRRNPRHHHRAGQLHRSGAGEPLHHPGHREDRVPRHAHQQGDLGQPAVAVPRGIRGVGGRRRARPERLLRARKPTRSTASAPNSPSRSSARFSKRSRRTTTGLQTSDYGDAGAEAPAYCPRLRTADCSRAGLQPRRG